MWHILKLNIVISPEQGFMYAKAPKTAGTSIYRKIMEKHIPDVFLLDNNKKWIFKNRKQKLYKFTVVRNPWGRLVSNFTYCKKLKYAPIPSTFSDFITFLEDGNGTTNLKAHCRTIHEYFLFEGEQWVDRIYFFECLVSEWQHIRSKVNNLPEVLPLSNKSNHANYRQYYTDNDIDRVYVMYKTEIDYLGYSF